MSIYEKMKSDINRFRKQKDSDTVRSLTTFVGSLEGKAAMVDGVKTVSDMTALQVLKSWKKNLDELFHMDIPEDKKLETTRDLAVLANYLPEELDSDQITLILTGEPIKTMPEAMKFLKENYAGQYDGKIASAIAKALYN